MTIPQRFMLFGQTIEVKTVPRMAEDRCLFGLATPNKNEILLSTTVDGCAVTPEKMEQTFFHELVHFILHSMSHKLYNDETFVDLFGHLLHQFLITAEGDVNDIPIEDLR